jgi:chromosomal replication initiator protein
MSFAVPSVNMAPRANRAAGGAAIRIADIQRVVADRYGVPLSIMRIPDGVGSRRAAHVKPRQIAMCLAARLSEHSLNRIGDFFGGRDHTTVIHANRKIQADPLLQCELRWITMELLGR